MTTPATPSVISTVPDPTPAAVRLRRRHGWLLAVTALLGVLVLWRVGQIPAFGSFEVRTIVAGTMALAFLAMAQAVVVLSGGVDLSVGSMMVLANCVAATWMLDAGPGRTVAVAVAVLVLSALLAGLIGLVITMSGIPDIVVTLAASFTLGGLALIVLPGPGGGTSPAFQSLVVGGFSEPLPSVLWTAGALLLVWLPFKRSRWGIALYAVGSDRRAAFLSGVGIARTRIVAYTLGGLFSGAAGLVTLAFTGSGEPRASIGAVATLTSVAAVVLGGVALVGGVGGLLGPVLAAFCLALIPALMLGLDWDPNYAEVARGVIVIAVVMVGGLLQLRRRTT